jgi:hypothetical protein
MSSKFFGPAARLLHSDPTAQQHKHPAGIRTTAREAARELRLRGSHFAHASFPVVLPVKGNELSLSTSRHAARKGSLSEKPLGLLGGPQFPQLWRW